MASQHSPLVGKEELRCRRFELDEEYRAYIEEAVLRAPKRKEEGDFEMFAEALQQKPWIVPDLLFELSASFQKHVICQQACGISLLDL